MECANFVYVSQLVMSATYVSNDLSTNSFPPISHMTTDRRMCIPFIRRNASNLAVRGGTMDNVRIVSNNVVKLLTLLATMLATILSKSEVETMDMLGFDRVLMYLRNIDSC